MRRTITRALLALALVVAIAATLLASLGAIAWQALAARDGEWSQPLHVTLAGHRFEQRASVALHPALDAWMLTEGYGRTLSRPGLDLLRRELCVIAQTAVLDTPRQLHSHLRGALNAGGSFETVEAALLEVIPFVPADQWKSVKELWEQVRDSWSPLA